MSTTPPFEYRFLDQLGRGGMGTVFRAEMLGPEGFSKIVAVKILNPEVQGNPDLVQRLRDEARMLGLVRHRAIVQVDRLTTMDGRSAIVMEYVAGFDLAEILLRHGPVPLGPALEIAAEIASALHVAYHSPPEGGPGPMEPLRLVHRDIKPANLRITPSGGVKLLDFGVAQARFPGREAHTDSLRYGSTRYMSPQRLCWEDDGPAGDVYALGAVLFELLQGRPLGLASDQPEMHAHIVSTACKALAVAEVPAQAIALVEDSLAFAPEHRPDARLFFQRARRAAEGVLPSLQEWCEALAPFEAPLTGSDAGLAGQVLREDVISAGSSSNLTLDWPVPVAEVVHDVSIRIPEPPARPIRKRPFGWIAVALGSFALAAVLGFGVFDPPEVPVPVEIERPTVPCAIPLAGERDLVSGVDALFRAWQQLDVSVLDEALAPEFARRDHASGRVQDRAAFLAERERNFARTQLVTWTGPERDVVGFGVPVVVDDLVVRCRANDHVRVVVRYDWTVLSRSGVEKGETDVVDAYEVDAAGQLVENIDYADLNMAVSWRDGCCL